MKTATLYIQLLTLSLNIINLALMYRRYKAVK